MTMEPAPGQLATLHAHAAGQLGTREAIDRAGMRDYADLVIALARNGLDLPKPSATPAREARVTRARAILQPRPRHDD